MQTLIIYDNTGKIWNITYSQYAVPEGLVAEVVDVPEGSQIERIEMPNEEGKVREIIYATLPDNDIRNLKAQITTLRTENAFMSTALTFAAETFTDEQALKVPSLYEYWMEGATYKEGKRVRYNDILYKVLQDHTSQADWTPDVATSLFAKVLIEDPTAIPEWVQPDSTNPYMTGDKVIHNGVTYESLIDNNVWEPGATGSESLWAVVE